MITWFDEEFCQYAGERRDPHPWILDTKDHRIKSRVLSHIFSRTLTGTWWNLAETRHSQERLETVACARTGYQQTRQDAIFVPRDKLLLQLKGEGLSWDEISDYFRERSNGTLQVRYCTKLKPRPEKSKNTRKRRRSGWVEGCVRLGMISENWDWISRCVKQPCSYDVSELLLSCSITIRIYYLWRYIMALSCFYAVLMHLCSRPTFILTPALLLVSSILDRKCNLPPSTSSANYSSSAWPCANRCGEDGGGQKPCRPWGDDKGGLPCRALTLNPY